MLFYASSYTNLILQSFLIRIIVLVRVFVDPLKKSVLTKAMQHGRNDEYLNNAMIPVDTGIIQDLLTQPFPPMSSITKI